MLLTVGTLLHQPAAAGRQRQRHAVAVHLLRMAAVVGQGLAATVDQVDYLQTAGAALHERPAERGMRRQPPAAARLQRHRLGWPLPERVDQGRRAAVAHQHAAVRQRRERAAPVHVVAVFAVQTAAHEVPDSQARVAPARPGAAYGFAAQGLHLRRQLTAVGGEQQRSSVVRRQFAQQPSVLRGPELHLAAAGRGQPLPLGRDRKLAGIRIAALHHEPRAGSLLRMAGWPAGQQQQRAGPACCELTHRFHLEISPTVGSGHHARSAAGRTLASCFDAARRGNVSPRRVPAPGPVDTRPAMPQHGQGPRQQHDAALDGAEAAGVPLLTRALHLAHVRPSRWRDGEMAMDMFR